MRILTVSDIHSDYTAIRHVSGDVSPDLVLDCGDHEKIGNFTGLIPHYYVAGNHEPGLLVINHEDLAHPHRMSAGTIYRYIKDNEVLNFAGIGGNYSSKIGDSVRESDLEALSNFEEGEIDLFMFHESPYNVINSMNEDVSRDSSTDSRRVRIAKSMIKEIDRIKPKIVISGHTGMVKDTEDGDTRYIVLPEIAQGYGVLDFNGIVFNYNHRKLVWR